MRHHARLEELGGELAYSADVVLAAAVVGHPDVHVEGGLAVLRREGAQGTPQGIASSLAMLLLFMPWRELNISENLCQINRILPCKLSCQV